ncbi:MAG: hypothetical protein WAX14_14450 [Rhodococcus sp. (in: high G+C Gram-positive bacteria)]|uniref:hypothetical protein n=1 Tax=Rhodococcus sp. TaxID=1831 RepID=UPI003BB4F0FE
MVTMTYRTIAACAAATIILTSCSSPESDHNTRLSETATTEPSRHRADSESLTHRWFAPEGIDLEALEVQVARAFRESDNMFRSTGTLDATYPGFPDLFRHGISSSTIAFPRVGTIDDHIFDVRPVRDTRGRTVTRIVICEDRSGVAEPTGNTWTVRETAIGVIVITVARTTDAPASPPVDPTTRAAFPTWNVFDGWTVEDSFGDHQDFDAVFSSSKPEDQELQERCLRDRPQLNPDADSGDVLTAAPVVETPVPGWPIEIGEPN